MSTSAPRKTPRRASGLPLLGALPALLWDPLRTLGQIAAKHRGEIVAVPLGPVTAYYLTQPEQVAHVLHDRWRLYPKGQSGMWVTLRRLLGDSVVTVDGEQWVAHRRLLQPLFSSRSIDGMAEGMISAIETTLEALRPQAESRRPVWIDREMAVLTQNVVLATVFGATIGRSAADELATAMIEALHQMGARLFLFFLPRSLPLPGELRFRQAIRRLDDAMLRLLHTRRTDLGPNTNVLSLLLAARDPKSGEPLTDRYICDEMLTLFAGGYETTALALTWALYLLSQNPQELATLRAEVDAVLGKRRPIPSDLPKLRYTKWVLKEALRLYPPSWLMTRCAAEDDVIEGYAIPKGAMILISPYVLQRDLDPSERGEAFLPERFAHEEARQRCRYMPFGAGPRLCIGDQFALMEGQFALAMFMQRFSLQLTAGQRVQEAAILSLRPRHGVRAILVPRT